MDSESESNPYQAPTANTETRVQPLPDADALFNIPATAGKRCFRVIAFEDRLQFLSDDGAVAEVLRHQPMFVRLVKTIKAFTLKTPKKSFGLIFAEDDFNTLCNWIGPPTMVDLREALGAKSWWQIPVAIMLLIPGPEHPLNILKAGLLLTHWAGAKFKPSHWWFIPMSLAFFLIFRESAEQTYRAHQAGESLPFISMLFGVACLLFAWSNFKHFFRYRTLAPPYESFIAATLVDDDEEDEDDSLIP